VAEWSCSGLQSRLRRFDSDPSLICPVLRRPKKINGVAKSPENPADPAYRRLELSVDRISTGWGTWLVTPIGGRLWRFRYRLGGVEKLLALGAHPDVTLKRAREKRDQDRPHSPEVGGSCVHR
jgi:hypothetical protein